MKLKKSDISKVIEGHFNSDLVKSNYEIKELNPEKLLMHSRFDLGFKLLYLDLLKEPEYSNDVYLDHIRAFSLGTFIEPGNPNKKFCCVICWRF